MRFLDFLFFLINFFCLFIISHWGGGKGGIGVFPRGGVGERTKEEFGVRGDLFFNLEASEH